MSSTQFLTSSGTFDRSAILRDALGLYHRSRGTYYAKTYSLSRCMESAWADAKRQRARFLTAPAHNALFGAIRAAFSPDEVDPGEIQRRAAVVSRMLTARVSVGERA